MLVADVSMRATWDDKRHSLPSHTAAASHAGAQRERQASQVCAVLMVASTHARACAGGLPCTVRGLVRSHGGQPRDIHACHPVHVHIAAHALQAVPRMLAHVSGARQLVPSALVILCI
eukprot:366133-Chlamydomonas_euryale.AAC.1